MKDLKERLISEASIIKKVKRWLDKVADTNTTGIVDPASDAIKKLPAECVLRIAVDMACLLSNNYFSSMPDEDEAKYMFYDCEYLQLTLGYDTFEKYKADILKVMQAMYLSVTDRSFAYEYNRDPSLYKSDNFKAFKDFKK